VLHLPLSFLSGAPSIGETLIIAVAIVVLFGPRRLPELLRKAGRIFGELRKTSEEFKRQIMELDKVPPEKPASPETKSETAPPDEHHEQAG
jgi:Sec-independent protein translocase protein TatA